MSLKKFHPKTITTKKKFPQKILLKKIEKKNFPKNIFNEKKFPKKYTLKKIFKIFWIRLFSVIFIKFFF